MSRGFFNTLSEKRLLHSLKSTLDKSILSDRERVRSHLEGLAEKESWTPFFAALSDALEVNRSNPFFLLEMAAYTSLRRLGDRKKCLDWTRKWLMSMKKPSLELFMQNFLVKVVESNDYASQAHILEDSLEFFAVEDQILAYERLAYLYEKKLFKESDLARIYQKLLVIDVSNIKALKYLKLAFSHEGRWSEVVSVLNMLIERSKSHAESVSRYAHELATVYLYDLGDPSSALQVLDRWCRNTHLDTTVLRFDCQQTLSNWDECVNILREIERAQNLTDSQKAAIHYKKGCILEGLQRWPEALICFREAISILPSFLECYEKVIVELVKSKDLQNIRQLIVSIQSHCKNKNDLEEIRTLQARIEKALHA